MPELVLGASKMDDSDSAKVAAETLREDPAGDTRSLHRTIELPITLMYNTLSRMAMTASDFRNARTRVRFGRRDGVDFQLRNDVPCVSLGSGGQDWKRSRPR
jgi:hypothetical protein